METIIYVIIIAAVVLATIIVFKKYVSAILSPFAAKKLLNKSESTLFKMAKPMLPADHHLMTQVAFGEFLRCKNRKRFWTINAKRADFVICDENFNVVAVLEYQGSGHFGSSAKSRANAEKRDNQKRTALREAKIPLIELPANVKTDDLRTLIKEVFSTNEA